MGREGARRPGPKPQCALETPALPPTQSGPRAQTRQTSSSESFKLPQCNCRVLTPTPISASRSNSTCSRLFDYSRARRLGKSGSSCLGPPRLLRRALRNLVPPKCLRERASSLGEERRRRRGAGEEGGAVRIEVSFKLPNSRARAEVQANAAFSCTARRVSNRLTQARSLGFHGVLFFSPLVLKPGFLCASGGGRTFARAPICVRGRRSLCSGAGKWERGGDRAWGGVGSVSIRLGDLMIYFPEP